MSAKPNNSQSGFTLLEMLVVLVIVAVMAGLLVFSAGDSPARKLQREARALAALINTATDDAVMHSREIGLVIDDSGYRFVSFDPKTKSWLPLQQKPLSEHKFDEPYTVQFQLDGERIDEATRARIEQFSGRGGGNGKDKDDSALKPVLLMLSSGEITAFTLTLENDQAAFTLSSDGFNAVEVVVAPAQSGRAG